MRRSRRWAELLADDGSASIEFLTVGMLLTIPLVYLVLAMAQLQAASLAVEGAARQAARVLAAASTQEQGLTAADAAIVVALADLGLEPGSVEIACDPEPGDCTTPGGTVQVTVEVTVPMPLVPAALDLDAGLATSMQATALQPVSELEP